MKKKIILITIILFAGFATSLAIFIATKSGIVETVTITLGVTFYHFTMRLVVGNVVNSIMRNQANYNNIWFREKNIENRLYTMLRVRKWKKYLPTFNPETFDTSKKTVEEIVMASCQAEVVHEIIMLLSLLPLALIPFFGAVAAFVVTSVLSLLFDSMFVILQRYNRPKLIRIMSRFSKLK